MTLSPRRGISRSSEDPLAQARILQSRQVQNITFLAQACQLSLRRDHSRSSEFTFYFSRTLDTNFVSVSEHHVAENTTSEDSDSVHSVAFHNFDHSVHSENMAQPPTRPGPRERTLKELAAPDFTYDSLCIQYEDVPYVLKTGLIHLLPKFNGLAGQDPHKHLKEFHIVCSSMKPHDVMEDHICLKTFPHSLEGPTKDWLYYLAPGSITSWGDLKRSFLGKFFPASRTTWISGSLGATGQFLLELFKVFSWNSRLSSLKRGRGVATGRISPERDGSRLSERESVIFRKTREEERFEELCTLRVREETEEETLRLEETAENATELECKALAENSGEGATLNFV
ncbi:hypothetical protein Lal_00037018, partial [Lupinus albus]